MYKIIKDLSFVGVDKNFDLSQSQGELVHFLDIKIDRLVFLGLVLLLQYCKLVLELRPGSMAIRLQTALA